MGDNKAVLINFDFITYCKLKAKAAQDSRTMTDIVRKTVMDWLEEHPPEYPLGEWRALYDQRQAELKKAEEANRKAKALKKQIAQAQKQEKDRSFKYL